MATEPQVKVADVEQRQELVNGMEPEVDEDASWVAEDTEPVGVAGGCGQSEHVVRREENPAFRASHTLYQSPFQSRMARGLVGSRPLLTSTPQLSPVTEMEGAVPHSRQPRAAPPPSRLQSIPEQSQVHPTRSVFHTTPSVAMENRTQ